jgi:hypothetical protein
MPRDVGFPAPLRNQEHQLSGRDVPIAEIGHFEFGQRSPQQRWTAVAFCAQRD